MANKYGQALQSAPRGDLWLGPDFALLKGGLTTTSAHAHYAHQVLISNEHPLTVSIDGRPVSAAYVFIEALREHQIIEAPEHTICLFVEPLNFTAQNLIAALNGVSCQPEALLQALAECPRVTLNDSRLERAIATLEGALHSKVSAAAVADASHLSLSQLERLFGAHIGLSVRRLVLWRRLRRALSGVLAGDTLTLAAHHAGFADSAHFSRTMRKMFGIDASRLQRGVQCHLLD